MDSFHSETLSSDDSIIQVSKASGSRKKFRLRKVRRTEELVALDTLQTTEEETKQEQPRRKKRENMSFLPKIDVVEKIQPPVTKTAKLNRSSLLKKRAAFKVGKSLIEGRKVRGVNKSSMKLKYSNNNRKAINKSKQKRLTDEKKSKIESDELLQVLSDAAEEFCCNSTINAYTSKNVSIANNNEASVILKDLYVKLVPLEKTYLLNEDQMLQLKVKKGHGNKILPLHSLNFSNSSSRLKLTRRQSYNEKENLIEVTTPKGTKIPPKRCATSIKKSQRKNNNADKNVSVSKDNLSCYVIIERLETAKQTIDKNATFEIETSALPTLAENTNLASGDTMSPVLHLTKKRRTYGFEISDKDILPKKPMKRLHPSSLPLVGCEERRSTFTLDEGDNIQESLSENHEATSTLMERDDVQENEECSRTSTKRMSQVSSTPAVLERRRSTFTLEENDLEERKIKTCTSSMKNPLFSSLIKERSSSTSRLPEKRHSTFAPEKNKDETRLRSKSYSHFLLATKERSSSTPYIPEKRKSTFSLEKNKNRAISRSTRNSEFAITSKEPTVNVPVKHRSIFNLVENKDQVLSTTNKEFSCTMKDKNTSTSPCVPERRRSTFTLEEGITLPGNENEQNSPTSSILQNRRSTLTLEESVNNIALLKTGCDSTDTPQKLSRVEKVNPENLLKDTLKNKFDRSHLDYSNITVRKHRSSGLGNVSQSTSNLGLMDTSPLWNNSELYDGDCTFEINDTDDINILPDASQDENLSLKISDVEKEEDEDSSSGSSLTFAGLVETENLEKQSRLVTHEIVTVEDKEEDSSSSSSLSFVDLVKSSGMTRQTRRVTFDIDKSTELISSSDDDEYSDLIEPSHSATETSRVTRELDSVQKENESSSENTSECISLRKETSELTVKDRQSEASTSVQPIQLSSRKSMLKGKNSDLSNRKNHRVTFSNTSVIIVDDSFDSPKVIGEIVPIYDYRNKKPQTLIPTANVTCSPNSNKKGTHDCTPICIEDHVDSPQFNRKGTVGRTPLHIARCVESPQFNRRGTVGHTPKQIQSTVDSGNFNKTGTVGRTPLQFRISSAGGSRSFASPGFNRKINSDERLKLENNLLASAASKKNNSGRVSKRTKMPDFANIHKKMFDKMQNIQEYSKCKNERIKLLLSGGKPTGVSCSLKTSSCASNTSNNSLKKMSSKKELKYLGEPSTSTALPAKQNVLKKPQLVSSTPISKKNEKSAYTRYGFRVVHDRSLTKKEQIMAVANKVRPPKSNTRENRTEIKGVRSNRRFDLLMKMRNKK